MSSKSDVVGPADPVNAAQDSLPQIEDFLTRLKDVVAHQGFSQIGGVLAQLTELQRKHARLEDHTQQLKDHHRQKISELGERDAEFRHKSLEDYRASVEGLHKDKHELSADKKSLTEQIEQRGEALQVAERRHRSQVKEIEALRKDVLESKECAKAVNRQLQEAQKILSDSQLSTKKADEVLRQRDIAESKFKEETATSLHKAQEEQRRANSLQKTLDKIKDYVVPVTETEPAALAKELDTIWLNGLKLVKTVAFESLAESIFENGIVWQDLGKLAPGLPLPASNSSCAKSMRAILLLHLLTQSLLRYIFTTTYLFFEAGELEQILGLLAERDSRQERFVRTVLLRLFTDDRLQMIDKRVTRLVEELASSVEAIVPPEKFESFKYDIKSVAETAAQTWSKFQTNRLHFRLSCELTGGDSWEWRALRTPIDGNTLEDLCPDEHAIVVLFPQLLTVDEAEDKLIAPGISVADSQLTEAEEEIKMRRATLSTTARYNSTRSRARTREPVLNTAQNPGASPGSFLGKR